MITEQGSRRLERVEKEITKLISEFALRNLSRSGSLFTITATEISHDLKFAKVKVSTLSLGANPDQLEKDESTVEVFENARREIQAFLGKNLRTKFSPKLTFEIDGTFERQLRVQKLIHEISK